MYAPLALMLAVQMTQAAVGGTVRDELSGEPLAGALIALGDLDREAVTGTGGRFGFGGLLPGLHHITVTRPGFESRTLHALLPRAGWLELNVALKPVPMALGGLLVEPRLVIRGAESVRRTPGPAELISLAAVRNHPLLAEPDVFKVLEGGDVAVLPESPAGLHVRGGASGHTAYEIDGIPVLAPFHAAGLFSAWNPDALTGVHLTRASDAVLPSLSGTVVGVTRTPGSSTRGTAAVSTTHARATVDGPLFSGGGYMLSVRSGLPAGVLKPGEPAKIQGESGDLLAKVEFPLLGGGLNLLGYDSENELNSGALAGLGPAAGDPGRNGFEWRARALGATWKGTVGSSEMAIRAWDSQGVGVASLWAGARDLREADNVREERGLMVTLSRSTPSEGELFAGARLTSGSTRYRTASSEPFAVDGALSTAALLLGYGLDVFSGSRFRAEVDVTASSRGARVSPLLTAQTSLGRSLTVSAALSRRHQFVQSLRNEESLLGTVFPADLFVTAGSAGVPTARADEASLRLVYRPFAGLSIGSRAYVRALDSVVFVAPRTGLLFSSGAFEVGSSEIRGISVDAAVAGSRYGLVADYGFQRVLNSVPERSYVPSYAPSHRAQIGILYHTSPTLSVRLATTGIWGRSATALVGAVEWEACNLADDGCELVGAAPHGEALGESRPGSYLRTDLGLRKHWHLALAGRDAVLALYGTLTNVLNRSNTLNHVIDPLTGSVSQIDMLALSPLVVGFELAF